MRWLAGRGYLWARGTLLNSKASADAADWRILCQQTVGAQAVTRHVCVSILNLQSAVSANEGRVLIDGPGLAVTLDIEAASVLSDQLLAGCSSARRQKRDAISQASQSGLPSSD